MTCPALAPPRARRPRGRQSTFRRLRRASAAAALAALLPLPAAPAPGPGREGEPDRAAEALFARLLLRNAQVRDFRARFDQKLVMKGLNDPPVESGRVFYSRPHRMRWEYGRPEEKLAISDGRTGWLWLPAEKRAVRMDLTGKLEAGALADLLSGRPEALRSFRASPLPATGGGIALRLEPVESVEEFDAIELRAEEASLRVTEVQVLHPGGGRMVYRFSRMEENVGLPDSLFTFTPPKDAEVIEN